MLLTYGIFTPRWSLISVWMKVKTADFGIIKFLLSMQQRRGGDLSCVGVWREEHQNMFSCSLIHPFFGSYNRLSCVLARANNRIFSPFSFFFLPGRVCPGTDGFFITYSYRELTWFLFFIDLNLYGGLFKV